MKSKESTQNATSLTITIASSRVSGTVDSVECVSAAKMLEVDTKRSILEEKVSLVVNMRKQYQTPEVILIN